MIEEPPLLTINDARRRPTAVQIKAFQGVPTGFVNDALFGQGALSGDISPLLPSMSVAGPALTADCGPADILASLAALKFLTDGDVLVSATSGFRGSAVAGDRLVGMAKNSGARGFVTDGRLRDANGIEATGLPIWSTGLTPASPFAKGPGRVGFPVQIGGQTIACGDMIVADRDGVVVVPFDRIDEAIATLTNVAELEAALDAEIDNGLKLPDDIETLLQSDQVRIVR